jgi:competence protein ComEC
MKRVFIIGSLLFLGLGLFVIYDYIRINDGKLHVVFCDVGQGDGIFIRTPSRKNILIDAGPDKSIVRCLSSHMPFWDRTIHKMILSHPHDDHFFGMQFVLDRYSVLSFDTEDLYNNTKGYKDLMEKVKKEKADMNVIYFGDILSTSDGMNIEVMSPSRTYLDLVSPNRLIAERGEQASLIQQLSYKDFDIYFASDNDYEIIDFTFENQSDPIEVLQVPHHGSRFGLTKQLLEKLSPQVAVISVGKNNYGHPSKEVIELLKNKEIKVLRTDLAGDLEIITDGKMWKIK